jgi:hypothetical protein
MPYSLNEDVCALVGLFDVVVFATATVFPAGFPAGLLALASTFFWFFVAVVLFVDTGFSSAVFG